MLRALEEPVRQIALNAGYEGSVVIDKLKTALQEQDLMLQQVSGLI